MQQLPPPVKPCLTHQLPVMDSHRLYVEECGRTDATLQVANRFARRFR